MVKVWSKSSTLGRAEIASFVRLVLFKGEGCRVSLRFHLLFLILIIGMKWRGEFKVLMRDPKDGKILLRSPTS